MQKPMMITTVMPFGYPAGYGNNPLTQMVPYILFFLAGLGWGYALPGLWKWTALLFPGVLALLAFISDGVSSEAVLELLLALGLTAAGVVIGTILAARGEQAQPA
jgi:hypothetical protein